MPGSTARSSPFHFRCSDSLPCSSPTGIGSREGSRDRHDSRGDAGRPDRVRAADRAPPRRAPIRQVRHRRLLRADRQYDRLHDPAALHAASARARALQLELLDRISLRRRIELHAQPDLDVSRERSCDGPGTPIHHGLADRARRRPRRLATTAAVFRSGPPDVVSGQRVGDRHQLPRQQVLDVSRIGTVSSGRSAAWWPYVIGAIVILGLALRLRGIHDPLLDHPGWRQGDTAAIARNFATLDLNLFHPQTDYDGPPPNYVELELQIVPFVSRRCSTGSSAFTRSSAA